MKEATNVYSSGTEEAPITLKNFPLKKQKRKQQKNSIECSSQNTTVTFLFHFHYTLKLTIECTTAFVYSVPKLKNM